MEDNEFDQKLEEFAGLGLLLATSANSIQWRRLFAELTKIKMQRCWIDINEAKIAYTPEVDFK